MGQYLEANGTVNISYEVDCPHCGETQYSDVDYAQWVNLEYGDGHPHGVLECNDCGEHFYVNIEE